MAVPEKLASLRHLLAERFPTVAGTTVAWGDTRKVARALRTGVPAIDGTAGGLPLSAVTELVCTAPSGGSMLFTGELLSQTRATRTRVGLIDGTDSFDPDSFPDDLLAHLLWVRCRTTAEALQAVDLVARDANLGLVVLDLRRAPETELRRTPATQWYRLQRAVESTDLALIVETPRPSVPSAQLRFILEAPLTVTDLDAERHVAVTRLAPGMQRQRVYAAAG